MEVVQEEAAVGATRINCLEGELENLEVCTEFTKLRVMENLCAERHEVMA